MFILSTVRFVKESYREFRHQITWPTYEELHKLSLRFFGAMMVIAAIVALINIGLQALSQKLYQWF